MKNDTKKNRTNRRNGLPVSVAHLEFTHPTAAKVCVAGTFNDWRPGTTPMICLGNGRWMKELVLPPGSYEYCLVVDGAWMPDPLAEETAPNPFGGMNAVLRVPPPSQPGTGETKRTG